MKPFKLQVVLEHRQRLEDQARQALAEALGHKQQLKATLADEKQQLDLIHEDYEQRQRAGMHSHEFILYENRISHKRQRYLDLEKKLGDAQQRVVHCRQALTEACREKKLLETLKEKKRLEALKEEQRREMVQIDEVAIMFRSEDKR